MIRLYLLALLVCCAAALPGEGAPPCYPVSGDQITGHDLAAAVPAMAGVPQDIKLGYAPAPGLQRSFYAFQIQQIASRYGIEARITQPVCFAWPMRSLSRDEIATAIRKSLDGRSVEIEITSQSQNPVPAGELIFPLHGLLSGPSKASQWNGYVSYAGGRRFSTWVQVQITVHEEQIVAVRAIREGEVVAPSDFKKIQYTGPLRATAALQNEDQVTGKCARLPIAAGTVFASSMLTLPLDVKKEELVTVHIQCGAAHVETQGVATDGGYRGDVIRVRNLKTGRVFRARIDDRGIVTVVVDGSFGLVVEGQKS